MQDTQKNRLSVMKFIKKKSVEGYSKNDYIKEFLDGKKERWEELRKQILGSKSRYKVEKYNNAIIVLYNGLNDNDIREIVFGKEKKKEVKIKRNEKKEIITLYHGSANPILRPKYQGGHENNDYGNGLYLTPHIELAKEWSISNTSNKQNGYIYKIEMDVSGLKILNFDEIDVLSWLAEIMSHRSSEESKRYRIITKAIINKYKINTEQYDIIKGWRADSSFFRIANIFVRDRLDKSLIKEGFLLGDLGIQYFIKSKNAFKRLEKEYKPIEEVQYDKYFKLYQKRDLGARSKLSKLENSDKNTLLDTCSKYIDVEGAIRNE